MSSEEAVSDILRFAEEAKESDNDLIDSYASDKDFQRKISNIDENLSVDSDHNGNSDEESIPINLVRENITAKHLPIKEK